MLGAFGFLADDLPVPNPNKSPKSPKISLNPSKPDVEYVYVPPPNGPPAPPNLDLDLLFQIGRTFFSFED